MREPLDGAKLAATLTALGQRARGPGRIYLAGGATALMMGIRAMTKDLEIKLQTEPWWHCRAAERLVRRRTLGRVHG